MKTITIEGKKRIPSKNKKSLIKLRSSKQVPCVVYNDKVNIPFSISEKVFNQLIYTPDVYKITLMLDSGEKYDTLIKETQFTPVEDFPLHVDFYALDPTKKVRVSLPIRTSGKCPGVLKGGNFSMPIRKIKLKALPHCIPEEINIDSYISNLEIGGRLLIKDIKIEGCEILHPTTMVVAAVNPSRESLKNEKASNEKEAKKK